MKYNFNHLTSRRGTGNFKWDTYTEDILPMWVADMDFPSPQPVVRALKEAVDRGMFGYPTGVHGSDDEQNETRQILCAHIHHKFHWEIKPEEIFFVPGVAPGFNLACHALADETAAVLIQPPIYPPILHAPGYTNATRQDVMLVPVQQPGGAEIRYEIDWDAFEKAFTPQTRLFILCNPHNPTGRVFTTAELERMASICLQKGVVICSDEVHCDLVYTGHHHIPVSTLDKEIAQQTITLFAPSKTYNLAGLQFSFAVIPNPELRKKYRTARKGLSSWINMMGWVAANAAYLEGQEWLDQLLPYLQSNRDFLFDLATREIPGIRLTRPEGTYLAWLDFRQTDIPGNPYEFCLNQAKVAFNDGLSFGPGGEGFVRLNFACPRSMLEEAIKRVKQAMER